MIERRLTTEQSAILLGKAKHMPRTRYQRGTLRTSVRSHGGKSEQKLPRGQYWAVWYQYVSQPDGSEKRRQREKIITKDLAGEYQIALDYSGPLTKSDAQKLLDLLIAEDAGKYIRPNTAATVGEVARAYLALAQPNWGSAMIQSASSIVNSHIIRGSLGARSIATITEPELQAWLNSQISAGASKSLHIRGVFKHARKQKIMSENPTEDLRAKSKKKPCERHLSIEECQRLEAAMKTLRDRLIVRISIQCGLRPEELFALRVDDVQIGYALMRRWRRVKAKTQRRICSLHPFSCRLA